jgi:hypothetical protein
VQLFMCSPGRELPALLAGGGDILGPRGSLPRVPLDLGAGLTQLGGLVVGHTLELTGSPVVQLLAHLLHFPCARNANKESILNPDKPILNLPFRKKKNSPLTQNATGERRPNFLGATGREERAGHGLMG